MTAVAALASWLGVAGTALQLFGSLMTLWGVLSAPSSLWQVGRALVGGLWRSPGSKVAAELSSLSEKDQTRVLQGVALFALGYVLALVSQIWLLVV